MHLDSKIFIAGHRGLIGSAFVSLLKNEGYNNLLIKSHEELDLVDAKDVANFFASEKPEYVVLAAGKVGGIVDNENFPADFLRINIAIQTNVIHSAQLWNTKKLIFFGSSCMYPKNIQEPMTEEMLFSGIPEPTSMSYAVSKMAGLQMCLAYNKQFGHQKFIPVIPNSAFGPNDNFNTESGHVLASFIRKLHEAKINNLKVVTFWGTGKSYREFIYSAEIARACLILMHAELKDLKLPINIGSGSDISIKQLAEKIASIVGYTGEIHWDSTKPDGAKKKLLNSKRMRQLGWSPEISFEEALKITYEWYIKNMSMQLSR